jgi:signal peptide peptidase SppA
MTSHRDAYVLGWAIDHPWAIDEHWMPIIAEVLGRHAAGRDDAAAREVAALQRRTAPQPPGGGVAIIPVYGVIAPRANSLTSMSGGTSFDTLGEQLQAAMDNPKVSTIIFDVDSPGGSVAGATEFAAQVRAARATKSIIAQAQHKMGSAAYWLSAQATKVYASPSAMVGSIGVYALHHDISKALEKEGVTRTYLSAGKYKVVGNEVTPLTEEAHAILLEPINAAMDAFIADVALGRGRAQKDVRDGYGEGKSVTAKQALTLGMIDGVATLEQTVANALDPAALAATADTSQEPSLATDQDRRWAHQQQVLAVALAQL